MQVRLNDAMPRDPDSLAFRLSQARIARHMTQSALAAAASMRQPDISKLELGLISQTTGIARLAKALRVSPQWLELGQWPLPDFLAATELTASDRVKDYDPLAHSLSLPGTTLDAQLVEIRDIVNASSTPQFFRTAISDDANVPVLRPGCEVLWSTTRQAKPGRMVLVRDSRGDVHVRQFRQSNAPRPVDRGTCKRGVCLPVQSSRRTIDHCRSEGHTRAR